MIDHRISDYCIGNSNLYNDILHTIFRNTHLKTLQPIMLSGPLLVHFYKLLINGYHPNSFLEIGTFTGYTASAFALYSSDNAKIDTIEINPEFHDIANEHFDILPNKSKINSVLADANEWIKNQQKTWDFIFIDAAKKDNLNYYKTLIQKLNPSGIMVIDNTLWKGLVLDENVSKKTQMIKDLNAFIKDDPQVTQLMLPIEDGISIIQKIN